MKSEIFMLVHKTGRNGIALYLSHWRWDAWRACARLDHCTLVERKSQKRPPERKNWIKYPIHAHTEVFVSLSLCVSFRFVCTCECLHNEQRHTFQILQYVYGARTQRNLGDTLVETHKHTLTIQLRSLALSVGNRENNIAHDK